MFAGETREILRQPSLQRVQHTIRCQQARARYRSMLCGAKEKKLCLSLFDPGRENF